MLTHVHKHVKEQILYTFTQNKSGGKLCILREDITTKLNQGRNDSI